jgi:hypothetical protein
MSTTASQYTGTPVVLGYVTMYGGKASDREKRLAFRAKDGTVVVRRKSFDLGWQITTDQRVIDSFVVDDGVRAILAGEKSKA